MMGQLPLGLICHGDTQAGQQRLAPRGCGDEKCGPAQGKGKNKAKGNCPQPNANCGGNC